MPNDVTDNTRKNPNKDDARSSDNAQREVNDARQTPVDPGSSSNAGKTKELEKSGILPSCTITNDHPTCPGPNPAAGKGAGGGIGGIGGMFGGVGKSLEKDGNKDSVKKNADGASTTTNAAGQVTEVDYKNGNTRNFAYNPDGTVKSETDADGSTWQKGADGQFHQSDRIGRDTGGTAHNITVSLDGTVTDAAAVNASGQIISPATTFNLNGSSVEKNPNGDVTQVTYPDGSNRSFTRDNSGNINQIQETDGSTWKHDSDGKWHQYKGDKPTGSVNDATPSVDSNGNYSYTGADGKTTVRQTDGSTRIQETDGSSSTTDSGGLLKEKTYPGGSARQFERDDKGNLTRIDNPDGSSWSQDNGQWNHKDASGKVLESAGYSPRVFADGSFSISEGDGTTYNGKPDGTAEAKRGDGSTVKYDNENRITSVDYPGGAKRSFTYDGTQLTSFTDTTGKVWQKDGAQWQLPDGSKTDQQVSVDGTGNLVIGTDGGNKNKFLTNGSSITTDGNDQVTHVNYADGKSRDFQRDQNGNITTVTETDGHKWTKQDDGKWHEFGTDNKPTGKTNDASPDVDAQGNYKITSPDGSWQLRKSDGSTVTAQKDGLVTQIDYADGKQAKFSYNDKKELVTMQEGNEIAARDKNGNWVSFDKTDPLSIHSTDPIIQVFPDGTIRRSNGGGDELTSTDNVTSNPNPGHNLWGVNSDNPLKSITPDAVHQGDLGDCYFLAALASKAQEDPQSVKNMIRDNNNGTYTVTFPGDPNHPVTVDCPTQQEIGKYAHDDGQNGMWVNVIEKAHRKLTGKDTSDDGGDVNDGVNLLSPKGTGTTDDDLSGFIGIGRTTKGNVEQDIERALNNHEIVVGGTGDSSFLDHLGTQNDPSGYVGDHVYAITGYDPKTQTITMRNPWGQTGKDGTFTMSLDDFYNKFSDLGFANA